MTENNTLLDKLFRGTLLRYPTAQEEQYYQDQLDRDLLTPTGFVMKQAATDDFVNNALLAGMFQAAFGRYGSALELTAWRQVHDQGMSLTMIGEIFINSREFSRDLPESADTLAVLRKMATMGYGEELGAAVSDEDLSPLVNGVNSGQFSYGDLLLAIAQQNERLLDNALAMLAAGLESDGNAPTEEKITGLDEDVVTAVNTLLAEAMEPPAEEPEEEPTEEPEEPEGFDDGLTLLESGGVLTVSGETEATFEINLFRHEILIDGGLRPLDEGQITEVETVNAEHFNGPGVIFTGNDQANTYTASQSGDTIRGRGGDDQLYAGAGQDSFIFEATASTNGFDRIHDFALGEDGDVLDFTLFLNQTKTTHITPVEASSNEAIAWTNGDILVASGYELTSPEAVAELFGADKPFANPAGSGKAVLITADIVGDATVWYLVNQTETATISPEELTPAAELIGINNLTLVGFSEGNFA